MKKTIALIVATFAFLLPTVLVYGVSTPVPHEMLPQLPSNHPAINDFAGTIDDAVQAQLEAKIVAYENASHIAVCVVTVTSLNGYDPADYSLSIFNDWKIGHAGSNMGILIMHAPTEQKVQMTTGYGMEEYIPDATCKRIIENDIIPHFKANDLTGGITAGVDAVMAHLGTMSVEERQKVKTEEQAEADRKSRQRRSQIWETLSGLFAGGVFIGIILLIVRWFKRSVRRKRVFAMNSHLTDDLGKGETMLRDAIDSYKSQPSWAKKELYAHTLLVEKSIADARVLITKSNGMVKGDVDGAEKLAHEAAMNIDKAVASFKKIDVTLKEKIKRFSEQAPIKFFETQKALQLAQSNLMHYKQKGFNFARLNTEVARLIAEYEALKPDLSNVEKHKEICEQSQAYQDFATKLVDTANERNAMKEKVDANLPAMEKLADALRQKTGTAQAALNELQQKYRKDSWSELAAHFDMFVALIAANAINSASVSIRGLNSMETQDFPQALSKYEALEKSVQSVQTFFQQIADTKKAQLSAQEKFPAELKSTKSEVEKALEKVKDSDVGSGAKSSAKDAAKQLEQVRIESGSSLLNWILLYELLMNCKKQAGQAYHQAESDIHEANEARRRAAEAAAAAKRKREEDEESSRRAASYSSSSWSSSGSSFGGGGGGFGGYSGGMSGGGGAGGGY